MGTRNHLISHGPGAGDRRRWRAAMLVLLTGLLAGLLAAAGPVRAGDDAVTIGFRIAPPYVISRPDGVLLGLEYELVMAAAEAGGLAVTAETAPFGRLPEDFRRHRLDAFVPASAAMALPGCLSDTVLVYQNVAFTLQQERLPISEIHDLAYYDVLAFQNAHNILGPQMAQVQKLNTRYHEVANQVLQVRALFSRRTDVVIADRRIFRFLMHSADAGIDTSAPVTEHALFPPTNYSVAFRDMAVCSAFNAGLQRLRRDGRYDAIQQKWDAALQAAGATRIRFSPG